MNFLEVELRSAVRKLSIWVFVCFLLTLSGIDAWHFVPSANAKLNVAAQHVATCRGRCAQGNLYENLQEPTSIALDVAAGKMYWTDFDTNRIKRANLDGSDIENLICDVACEGGNVDADMANPISIVLDLAHRKLYWVDIGSARIKRANLDGSQSENVLCRVTCEGGSIDRSLEAASTMALSPSLGKIYWVDFKNERIKRANLDGSNSENILCQWTCLGGQVDSTLSGVFGIALDEGAGKMYWVNFNTDLIKRANLDGTLSEILVCKQSCEDGHVDAEMVTPHGITLDVEAGKLYWLDFDAHTIKRANLDGSDIENLLCASACSGGYINADIAGPATMTLDVGAGKMYWTDIVADRIKRANLDGSDSESILCRNPCATN